MMNRFLLVIFAAFSLAATGQTVASFASFSYEGNDDFYKQNPLTSDSQFYNPILAGWHSDPSIVRTGNDYYLVTSTFGYFPGIPIFHSNDLVNWKQIGNVLDRDEQLTHLGGQSLDKEGIYAPQIAYNPADKLYYMITSDVGQNKHFYVTTTDPHNSWSNPIYLDNIDGIDPSFFFDDDGQSYIVFKEDTEGQPKWSNHRCIRFIRFDAKAGQTVGESVKFKEEGVGPEEKLERDEGPHLYKVNGWYYLICAEGGTGDLHSEVVYKSRNVFGPYSKWPRNPMLTQRYLKANRPNPVSCAGHVDMVQTPEGDWWGVFLACRQNEDKFQALGRETFILPVKWSADGYPYMLQAKEAVPLILEREGVKREASQVSGNFRWEDEFDGSELGPEWMSLRSSASDLCTLEGGCLKLRCSEEQVSGRGTPAYKGRCIAHHKFTAETAVRFSPLSDDEYAGLLMLKNEAKHYFMAVSKGKVSLLRSDKAGLVSLGEAAIDNGQEIGLRVVSHSKTYDFEYREGNGDWKTLISGVDASFISCERSGGFTGATIGVYCTKVKK